MPGRDVARSRTRTLVRAAFGLFGAALVAASVTAFLDTGGALATLIQPVVGAGGVTGAPFDIVATDQTVTIPKGRASLTAGQEIAYVQAAMPSASQTVGVIVNWLDPQAAKAVLRSPNAEIVLGLYYPVASSADCTTAPDPYSGQAFYDVTAPASTVVCLAPGASSWAVLQAPSRSYAGHTTGAILSGLPVGQSTFYVLASIVTNGNAPAGQQGNIGGLQFRLQVLGQ